MELLKNNNAYADDTEKIKMREERMEGKESQRRNQSAEENIRIWNEMKNGNCDQWCIRIKIDMKIMNKCMRDPVIYRVKKDPHPRLGTK